MEQEMTASKEAYFEVADGIWGLKDYFVNVYMIQNQYDKSWVLVDAGLKTSASKIKKMARKLFGEDSRPEAIVLTHGHFDHVGSLKELAEQWDVKVYAHEMEVPYLTGKSSYPPPDPTVGGGMMAWMADLYPKAPINIKHRLEQLPNNDKVPGLQGWRYIHTPGHAPGHISLWREKDKVLIAGDAFVTTKQESALSVLMQTECISGPPAYFTYDWTASEHSVNKLADLKPEVVATGHGKPMRGEAMQEQLTELANDFAVKTRPTKGRYKDRPAIVNSNGVVFVPPKEETEDEKTTRLVGLAGIVGLVALGLVLYTQRKRLFV
ncbi:MBL fold metallo-hydrolase [Telluribacter humicola]|uniref:MBL fold metallo-hydrolase n=1 Tax=Telluribacter humicola TaxID=1720261 RepID=UPI001E65AC23|nr:MBL fold metallo-hydrolase [Telluribacter humicola]